MVLFFTTVGRSFDERDFLWWLDLYIIFTMALFVLELFTRPLFPKKFLRGTFLLFVLSCVLSIAMLALNRDTEISTFHYQDYLSLAVWSIYFIGSSVCVWIVGRL